MAGRGCSITVKVIGNNTIEDISLPVALHSPLEVLKSQLADAVGIPVENQVLILLDLTDEERNSDILLTGRDYESLRDCSIRPGSVLTLHAVGKHWSEQNQIGIRKRLMDENKRNQTEDGSTQCTVIHSLETNVSAANADHSYNGIVFDVESIGENVVRITSIAVAGMLGRLRIYVRDRPWEQNPPAQRPAQNWWAYHVALSREGWTLMADRRCRPSWDRPIDISFNQEFVLMPHQRRGIYCHSSLPDDLGIQYQSYRKHELVASNSHLNVYPGLGHTGSEPFDEIHGWYRSYRGLAGSIKYSVHRIGWSIREHRRFPKPLKDAVLCMLLCNSVKSIHSSSEGLSQSSSQMENAMDITPTKRRKSLQDNNSVMVNKPWIPMGKLFPSDGLIPQRTCSSRDNPVAVQSMGSLNISDLPIHVIYYIMEFTSWDWFTRSVHDDDEEDEDESERLISKKDTKSAVRDIGGGHHMLTRSSRQSNNGTATEIGATFLNYFTQIISQAHPSLRSYIHTGVENEEDGSYDESDFEDLENDEVDIVEKEDDEDDEDDEDNEDDEDRDEEVEEEDSESAGNVLMEKATTEKMEDLEEDNERNEEESAMEADDRRCSSKPK